VTSMQSFLQCQDQVRLRAPTSYSQKASRPHSRPA
jgi:hypothetical protein